MVCSDMTYKEIVRFSQEHPYVKFYHPMFSDDEFLYATPDGKIWTEEGYLFEDWDLLSHNNGMRLRSDWNDWFTHGYKIERKKDGLTYEF